MSSPRNIIVLTQWSYKDPLIQAYTLPYVYIIADKLPAGSKIYLLTFEQKRLRLLHDEKKKIKEDLLEKGIILMDYSYSRFGILGLIKWFLLFLRLFFLIVFKNIKYIHAWCTPAGSLGYFLSILTRRPLIIDSYEPHAEAMVENNTWKLNGIKYRLLFFLEKKLSRHAKFVISATEGMREYARIKYGVIHENFFVKPACVDFTKFNPSLCKNPKLLSELNLENKLVCVYAGKFGGIYLTEEVFKFFSVAEKKWGDRFRALLLTPNTNEELFEWADKSGFSRDKMIIRFVPHELIPGYMGLGDFAITPVKPIPTKRYCTPIKDGEYWAMGLPVIITKDISDDSEIIKKNKAGAVIEELNEIGYKITVDEMEILLSEPSEMLSNRIAGLAKEFRSFSIAEKIYRTIYSLGRP